MFKKISIITLLSLIMASSYSYSSEPQLIGHKEEIIKGDPQTIIKRHHVTLSDNNMIHCVSNAVPDYFKNTKIQARSIETWDVNSYDHWFKLKIESFICSYDGCKRIIDVYQVLQAQKKQSATVIYYDTYVPRKNMKLDVLAATFYYIDGSLVKNCKSNSAIIVE